MLGATLVDIDGAATDSLQMDMRAADGRVFTFNHSQDCCETVSILDVIGDVADLLGSPLVLAEEVSSEGTLPPERADSYTWTFYRFATVKGTVTVRWFGESNGYYSEGVDFYETQGARV
jgi:hypothetical protein